MKRHCLYMFRCDNYLSQEEMAQKIGCSRVTYSNVERGARCGSSYFWSSFQKAFGIKDEDMYKYMKLYETNS